MNMWGLRWPFGEDDIERFRTLREVLRKEDYDFVLLQEVIALEMNKISHSVLSSYLPIKRIPSAIMGQFALLGPPKKDFGMDNFFY